MRDIIKWVIILGLIFFGFKAGWFNPITDYFKNSAEYARQEQVIQDSNGGMTTVRYRSFMDVVTGRDER